MRSGKLLFLVIVGAGMVGAASFGAKKAKENRAAEVATYEMQLPPLASPWEKRAHGPFFKAKFVSTQTGSMITLGESHGDADYVVTPDQDEMDIAQIVVQAGKANGWKTVAIEKPEKIGDARFVFVERQGGMHTYWTAVGLRGNSSFIVALTETGSDKVREANLKNEWPYFRKLVESSSFEQNPPTGLVASL